MKKWTNGDYRGGKPYKNYENADLSKIELHKFVKPSQIYLWTGKNDVLMRQQLFWLSLSLSYSS